MDQLVQRLGQYADFLQLSNKKQLKNQSITHPVRQFKDNATAQNMVPCLPSGVPCEYAKLDTVLKEVDGYESIIWLCKIFTTRIQCWLCFPVKVLNIIGPEGAHDSVSLVE